MAKNMTKAVGVLETHKTFISGAIHCVVDLSKIYFASYQRDAISSHVKKISGNFDPKAANPLKINFRDGKLYCYDGRQTSAALIEKGHNRHDAIVFQGMTELDEARYFYIQNDVPRKMNGWTKFYANMMAGSDTLKEIQKIVHKNNLTLPRDPGVHKVGNADITSPRALLEAFAMQGGGGTPLVDRMCRVLDKAWRLSPINKNSPVIPDAKKIDMLRGLMRFLDDHQKLPMNTIIMVLKHHTPDVIRGMAKDMPSKGRIDSAQIKQAFEKIFNEDTPKSQAA